MNKEDIAKELSIMSERLEHQFARIFDLMKSNMTLTKQNDRFKRYLNNNRIASNDNPSGMLFESYEYQLHRLFVEFDQIYAEKSRLMFSKPTPK